MRGGRINAVRLLVLGGSVLVGRVVVTAGIDRGWSVTTVNRARAARAHPKARQVVGDRLGRPTSIS